jgi:hypothetical protein
MSLREATPTPTLEDLLERGRAIRPVPDVVRARTLARARALVAAAITPAPEPVIGFWRRALPVAVAAAVALTVGVAGAVTALRSRTPQPPAPVILPRAPVAVPAFPPAPGAPVTAAESDTPAPPPARTARPLSPQESYAAELALLQRAQASYAASEFALALAQVVEHSRRFPHGRLTEEREALRIRSLVGAGRKADATRAAESFARRFPRSVLLPRLTRELGD